MREKCAEYTDRDALMRINRKYISIQVPFDRLILMDLRGQCMSDRAWFGLGFYKTKPRTDIERIA